MGLVVEHFSHTRSYNDTPCPELFRENQKFTRGLKNNPKSILRFVKQLDAFKVDFVALIIYYMKDISG